MKDCNDCGQSLPLSQFYRNCRTLDGLIGQCKACVFKRHRLAKSERAKRDRLYFQAIKLERGCVDCGFRAHHVALDFDHLPGSLKRYRVASMAGMKRELVDAEIAKCEVVCANCHRIRTATRLSDKEEI